MMNIRQNSFFIRQLMSYIFVMVHNIRVALFFSGFATLTLLAACDGWLADTPKTAKGDTPIRYIVCSAGDKNCFVVARFKDFETCESYKQISGSLCDRISTPGQIICKTDPGPTIAVAYCSL